MSNYLNFFWRQQLNQGGVQNIKTVVCLVQQTYKHWEPGADVHTTAVTPTQRLTGF